MHLDAQALQGQRNTSGADAQLQRPAALGQLAQRRHRRVVVAGVPVVVDASNAFTIGFCLVGVHTQNLLDAGPPTR